MLYGTQQPRTVSKAYRGRFAPSPTGPLHFGSLVTALGSYLDARNQGGEWLVRMEDLDRTREVAGAADEILSTLEAFGFEWDGEVIYQSQRTQLYAEALDLLKEQDLAYPCSCSRSEIVEQGEMGAEGPIYPGTCRSGVASITADYSIRLLTRDREISFNDRVQGRIGQNPGLEIGDFVIRRRDGFHAYQLAVVVDDAWQRINQVVRGSDLLMSTPRQCYLQELLQFPLPDYAHLPLAVDPQGRKLSKQYRDAPVDRQRPVDCLLQALSFLGQPLPHEPPESPQAFWRWAKEKWCLEKVPAVRTRQVQITLVE